MTARQMFKVCEKLYLETDWSNPESVAKYNEACEQLKKIREEENRQ